MNPQSKIDTAFVLSEQSRFEQDRLEFYARIAESELFLLLEQEADGEKIEPQCFPVEGITYVLAFDTVERLSQFAEKPVPFVAVSGRSLAQMIAPFGFGLGLNLQVAPSSTLLPPTAVEWLKDTLDAAPDERVDTPFEFSAPPQLPEKLLQALDGKLALAQGLAVSAYFCGVTYESGARTALLGFVNAVPGSEDALSQTVQDALMFSGVEAGSIDVTFVNASDEAVAKMARVGLRFDIPEPVAPKSQVLQPPGSDPEKPPKLR